VRKRDRERELERERDVLREKKKCIDVAEM
jgi:hypothetical protein